jgi:CRP-like cAMP-binding protein
VDVAGVASITTEGLAQCCWLLATAGDEVLEEVTGAFVSRTLSAGDTLCEQGLPCDAFYIVAQGTLGEYRATPGANSPVPAPNAARMKLRELAAGENFGDAALYAELTESLADNYYPSTCVAASPAVVLMLRGDAFTKLRGGNLQLAELVEQLVGKLNKVRAQGALRQMWPLLHLSDAQMENLGALLRPQACPAGFALCTAKAPCAGAFYVIEGEVILTLRPRRGLDAPDASPYTRMVGESEMFGVGALLNRDDPDVIEAKVVSSSVLLVLDQTLWEQLLEERAFRSCVNRASQQISGNLTADALARHWPFAALPAGVLGELGEVFLNPKP